MSKSTSERSRLRRAAAALAFLLAAILGGCAEAGEAPQSALNPAGPFARAADRLWDVTFLIAAVIFFLVEGALIMVLIRYRHREGRRAAQFHGNTKLEILLTAIPALILAGIAVPTVGTIFDLAQEPVDGMEIQVTAHQFWWKVSYPEEGVVTANEIHIPVDTDVRVRLEGAVTDPVDGSDEVIHSFWVPRLAGTQDVIPGQTTYVKLRADEPGTYYGQCKEYCGLSHANMRLRVIAQEQDDFEQWVREQTQPPSDAGLSAAARRGRAIFNGEVGGGQSPCASCHAVQPGLDAQPTIGPNLAHLMSRETFAGATFRITPQNLARWIRDPAAMRPGSKMPDTGLSDSEIQDVVAYLQTLE